MAGSEILLALVASGAIEPKQALDALIVNFSPVKDGVIALVPGEGLQTLSAIGELLHAALGSQDKAAASLWLVTSSFRQRLVIPMLSAAHPMTPVLIKESQAGQQLVAQCAAKCVTTVREGFADETLSWCLSAITKDRLGDDEDIEHRPAANEKLHPMGAAYLIAALLEHCPDDTSVLTDEFISEAFNFSLWCVSCPSATLRTFAINSMVPLCLRWRPTHQTAWEHIRAVRNTRVGYGAMCAWWPIYFPDNGGRIVDLLVDSAYWDFVEAGVLSADSVTRKRALFLLKRSIAAARSYVEAGTSPEQWTSRFQWSAARNVELQAAWENVFVLLDTLLFEKQMHIITPVLGRLDAVLSAAAAGDLAFSWFTFTCRAVLVNDLDKIARAAMQSILNASYMMYPAIVASPAFADFILEHLLGALVHRRYYANRDTQLGVRATDTALALMELIKNVTQAQSDGGKAFVRAFIGRVHQLAPHDAELLHMVHALNAVDGNLAWEDEELRLVADIVLNHMRMHHIKIRELAAECLARATLHLADTEKCDMSVVVHTLGECARKACLRRTSDLWQCLRRWVCEGGIKRRGGDTLTDRLVRDLLSTTAGDTAAWAADAQSLAFYVALAEPILSPAALDVLVNCCSQVYTHTYMDEGKRTRALLGYYYLMNELPPQSVLRSRLLTCSSDVMAFARANLLQIPVTDKLEQCHAQELCTELLRGLDPNILPDAAADTVRDCIKRLQSMPPATKMTSCTHALAKHGAILCLEALLPHISVRLAGDMVLRSQAFHAALSVDLVRAEFPLEIVQSNAHRSLVDRFLQAKWVILACQYGEISVVQGELTELVSATECLTVLETAVDEFSRAGGHVLLALLECTKRLLRKVIREFQDDHLELYDFAIHAAWAAVTADKDDCMYQQYVAAFVQAIYQPATMSLPGLYQDDGALSLNLAELLHLTNERAGIAGIVARGCSDYWRQGTEEAMNSAAGLMRHVVAMLTYGGKKRLSDIEARVVAHMHETYGLGHRHVVHEDAQVRAAMFDWLLRLRADIPYQAAVAREIVEALLKDVSISEADKLAWAHKNTPTHRRHVYAWQTIVALTPFLQDEEGRVAFLSKALRCLQPDNMWSSVRVLIEWACILLIQTTDQLRLFINAFKEYGSRPAAECSYTQIMCQVARLHLRIGAKVEILSLVIPQMMSAALSNHYTVRALAQFMLWRLSQELEDQQLAVFRQLVPPDSLEYLEKHPEIRKCRKRLQKDFFFTTFDPIRNNTFDFLFSQLLQVAEILEDDHLDSKELSPGDLAYMRRTSSVESGWEEQCDLRTGWRAKIEEEKRLLLGQEVAPDDELNDLSGNVQKKIMPWEQALSQGVIYTESQRLAESGERHLPSDLILVASLIDKIPNLAGLTRSCEIFQASLLVMDDLTVVDSLEFKSISRTAEKWMPLLEVKSSELVPWLKEKAAEGFAIVGIEQTAESVSLPQYMFPKKTVLVLGAEREGVPVEILQLLDACIEIPQLGKLRSLNVHVSGALVLYEHARQRLLTAA